MTRPIEAPLLAAVMECKAALEETVACLEQQIMEREKSPITSLNWSRATARRARTALARLGELGE